MKKTAFFLDKEERRQFIQKHLHHQKGVNMIKSKHSHRKIPGYWLEVHLEKTPEGKALSDKMDRIMKQEGVSKEGFFPWEGIRKEKLIGEWTRKYRSTPRETNHDQWKIFLQEIRNLMNLNLYDEAYLGLNLFMRWNPNYLKRYKRYLLFEELAAAFEVQGRIPKALRALKKPLLLNIHSEEPYIALSSFYYIQGSEEKAFKLARQTYRRFPKSPIATSQYVVLLESNGNDEDALKVIQGAEKLGVHHSLLYKIKGEILMGMDRDKEAITAFRKAYRILGEDHESLKYEILVSLGFLYRLDHQYEKAAKTLEKVVKSDPDDLYVRYLLINLYVESMKEYDRALIHGEMLMKHKPENFEYLTAIGSVYLGTGDFERAKWFFHKAKRISPEDFQVRHVLAKIKEFQKEEDENEKNPE